MGLLYCEDCKQDLPIVEFNKNSRSPYNYMHVCRSCFKKRRTKTKFIYVEYKTCNCCNRSVHRNKFFKDSKNNDGLNHICKDCLLVKKKRRAHENKLNPPEVIECRCNKCNKIKPVSEFNRQWCTITGYDQWCKECKCLYTKERAAVYKENEFSVAYTEKHCSICGELKQLNAFYNSKTKRDGKASECKVCTDIKNKKYADDNKEFTNQYKRQWVLDNKDKLKERHQYLWCTDPQYKLSFLLRGRLRTIITKKDVAEKTDKTWKLIGCTKEYLVKYLEDQFEDGMTWENNTYGGWHVDHIIPCDYWDFTKKENQYQCFHFTNLRPMWGDENIRKGANITTKEWEVYKEVLDKFNVFKDTETYKLATEELSKTQ